MINNKAGPLSFSPPKVNILFPLQHYMVTWRWIRLTIVSESVHYKYDHLGASCSNIGRIRTKENIAVDTHLIGKLPSSLGSFFLIIFES